MSSLSPAQFFHVAPAAARKSIEQAGIDYRKGHPMWEETEGAYAGNYLFADVADARIQRRIMTDLDRSEDTENYLGGGDGRYDIYAVSVPAHRGPMAPDPLIDNAVVTARPIPRGWVRRVE